MQFNLYLYLYILRTTEAELHMIKTSVSWFLGVLIMSGEERF